MPSSRPAPTSLLDRARTWAEAHRTELRRFVRFGVVGTIGAVAVSYTHLTLPTKRIV